MFIAPQPKGLPAGQPMQTGLDLATIENPAMTMLNDLQSGLKRTHPGISPALEHYPHQKNNVWTWVLKLGQSGVDKGFALKHFAQEVPAHTKYHITMGDNTNDFSMLAPNDVNHRPNIAVFNYRGTPQVLEKLNQAKTPGQLMVVEDQAIDPALRKAVLEKHGDHAIATSIPEALTRIGKHHSDQNHGENTLAKERLSVAK
jgi:hypothetical protein